MDLTESQLQAVKLGEPVRLVAPEIGSECVVVRADVFDRLKNVLYDDAPLSPSEKSQLLVDTGLRVGWDDAEMEIYSHSANGHMHGSIANQRLRTVAEEHRPPDEYFAGDVERPW